MPLENNNEILAEPTLTYPTLAIKEAYLDYIQEWKKSGENFVPYSADPLGRNFEDWLKEAQDIEKEETCPKHLVPANTYFLTDDDGRILGALNIRHRLNEYLLNFGGHIGYGVRPSERRKGYAKKLLEMALPIAKDLGIKKLLVTCDKDNVGSAKTILKNGGTLENEVPEGDKITQRYWINLE